MYVVRAHSAFQNNFVSILNKYSPKKTKILRENKNLPKQIMVRSNLKNKANK